MTCCSLAFPALCRIHEAPYVGLPLQELEVSGHCHMTPCLLSVQHLVYSCEWATLYDTILQVGAPRWAPTLPSIFAATRCSLAEMIALSLRGDVSRSSGASASLRPAGVDVCLLQCCVLPCQHLSQAAMVAVLSSQPLDHI